MLVDNSRECLKGESIRDLLRAVETSEYLYPVEIDGSLADDEKGQLRKDSIWASADITRWHGESVKDYTLRGLDILLDVITDLSPDLAPNRSRILWEALIDVQRRKSWAFEGEYTWFYRSGRWAKFPANFVKVLNEVAWVPDKEGVLQVPRDVAFKETGWVEDPYLLSRIKFKPAVIDELAREAGVELGAIDFLKRYGITRVSTKRAIWRS